MSPFSRLRHALLLPSVVVVSFALLGAGVTVALANGGLVEPTVEDVAKANAPFEPPSGLDVTAALPRAGEVGGAGAMEPADRPVSLAAEVGGVVAFVLVAEGQRVEAGQPLLRLRDEVGRAELAAAEADVRGAASEISALRADARAARARAAQSAATAGRTLDLFGRGSATPEERDRAERAREADEAAASAAAARAEQASARARSAEARAALARARLAQAELRAPSAGEVLQILVRPGESASAGVGAVVVGDTSRLRARIDVNERDALVVAVGQRARVRIEGSTSEITGRVVEVARRVGRKNVRSEDPTDRQDARFVETVVELDAAPRVPVGIRVEAFIAVR